MTLNAAIGVLSVLGGSWMVWSRLLSVLFLPAQVVYAMRQPALEKERQAFLSEHAQRAQRVSIPVYHRHSSTSPSSASTASSSSSSDSLSSPASRSLSVWSLFYQLKKRVRSLLRRVPPVEVDGKEVIGMLDGVEVLDTSHGIEDVDDSKNKKWKKDSQVRYLVHMNANGVCYEEKLAGMLHVQKCFVEKGWACNLLLFNYRGVGHSTGKVLGGSDLVEDASAVVQWLVEERGVRPCNVLVHGHSIGGAAAVLAAASMQHALAAEDISQHPFVLADRTFADLEAVVQGKLGDAFDMGPIGAILFANVSLLLYTVWWLVTGQRLETPSIFNTVASVAVGLSGTMLWESMTGSRWPLQEAFRKRLKTSQQQRLALLALRVGKGLVLGGLTWALARSFGSLVPYLAFTSSIGYVLGSKSYLNGIALSLVGWVGWRMELAAAWKSLEKHRKVVAFHARDEMIPQSVSLARHCEPELAEKVIRLKGNYASPHMYDAFMVPGESHQLLDSIQPFFS